MKKLIFAFLTCIVFFGCKSKEDKVANLIKDEMFKTLYDFESYEPIETKIDSAFTSVYTDTLVLTYASIANDIYEDLKESKSKYNDAISTIDIWSDSYSSLGQKKCKEAKEEIENYLETVTISIEQLNKLYAKIKDRNSSIERTFIGWQANHRFRCKTKGGNFDLGNYSYVVNKDVSLILYTEDLDSEDSDSLKGIINDAIESKDDTLEKMDSNTGATIKTEKDSIVSASGAVN